MWYGDVIGLILLSSKGCIASSTAMIKRYDPTRTSAAVLNYMRWPGKSTISGVEALKSPGSSISAAWEETQTPEEAIPANVTVDKPSFRNLTLHSRFLVVPYLHSRVYKSSSVYFTAADVLPTWTSASASWCTFVTCSKASITADFASASETLTIVLPILAAMWSCTSMLRLIASMGNDPEVRTTAL